MLSKQDKQYLQETFATKDDVKVIVENVLEPVKKDLKTINKKLDTTITHFDTQLNYHHRRLNQLEKHTGVEPPPYIILPTSAN
ncbi:MAG: hypothetical protein Q8L37_05105 [Candidatus Gottesmanbacteria bacterium]|nr:hypothetical protein [Candidatus Gottesmanbacteria bacterium]